MEEAEEDLPNGVRDNMEAQVQHAMEGVFGVANARAEAKHITEMAAMSPEEIATKIASGTGRPSTGWLFDQMGLTDEMLLEALRQRAQAKLDDQAAKQAKRVEAQVKREEAQVKREEAQARREAKQAEVQARREAKEAEMQAKREAREAQAQAKREAKEAQAQAKLEAKQAKEAKRGRKSSSGGASRAANAQPAQMEIDDEPPVARQGHTGGSRAGTRSSRR